MTTANRKLPSLNDVTPVVCISPKDLKDAWQDGDSTVTCITRPVLQAQVPW